MFWFRKLVGAVSRRWFPHGYCGRCSRTWNICESHVTPVKTDKPVTCTIFPGEVHDLSFGCGDPYEFNVTVGVFSLCESCWKELLPEQRLPYYRELYFRWKDMIRSYSWEALQEAVLDE